MFILKHPPAPSYLSIKSYFSHEIHVYMFSEISLNEVKHLFESVIVGDLEPIHFIVFDQSCMAESWNIRVFVVFSIV